MTKKVIKRDNFRFFICFRPFYSGFSLLPCTAVDLNIESKNSENSFTIVPILAMQLSFFENECVICKWRRVLDWWQRIRAQSRGCSVVVLFLILVTVWILCNFSCSKSSTKKKVSLYIYFRLVLQYVNFVISIIIIVICRKRRKCNLRQVQWKWGLTWVILSFFSSFLSDIIV